MNANNEHMRSRSRVFSQSGRKRKKPSTGSASSHNAKKPYGERVRTFEQRKVTAKGGGKGSPYSGLQKVTNAFDHLISGAARYGFYSDVR